jgi:hypothetical protein
MLCIIEKCSQLHSAADPAFFADQGLTFQFDVDPDLDNSVLH